MTYSEDLLVDFHCHLDLFPDFPASFEKAQNAGIATLAVKTKPYAFQKNRDLATNLSLVRVALGLHPQIVSSPHASLLEFKKILPSARYISEVGLDASPAHYRAFRQQLDVFSHIIRLADEHGGKIISIHSVRTVRQVLDTLELSQYQKRGTIAILHWFTGSPAELWRGVDLGCYFSINSAMLEKPEKAAVIKTLPITRILTETDAPFTKYAGRSSAALLSASGVKTERYPSNFASLKRLISCCFRRLSIWYSTDRNGTAATMTEEFTAQTYFFTGMAPCCNAAKTVKPGASKEFIG